MPLAQLNNLEMTFGQQVLFTHLDLAIHERERIGLIGVNGSGKTTLFRLLAGEQTPDSGTIALSSGVKVGYLQQDPKFDHSNTVIDEAETAFSQLHQLAHDLRELEHAMGTQTGDALQKTLNRYQTVQHDFDHAGGYVWHHKLEATLLGVGLGPNTWEQTISTLSGGQRSRLALARLLNSEPDLLLLDEPTNHLDLAAIEWLEEYLADFKGSVILVSHDRYLLDRIATRIVWLHQQRLDSYPGNYTAFVAQRDLQELSQARAHAEQQADIEKQKEFIRRFGAGQRAREAKGREKRLNRLLISDQVIAAVGTDRAINLTFDTDQRAGDKVLTVRNLSKSFGPISLWKDVSLLIERGARVGIIGPNGSGKTTLLKCLIGEADADAGEVRWGANLKLGYYDQRLDEFDPENSVYEEVYQATQEKEQPIRDMLGALLFRGDDIHKPVSLCSGGERARVRLAQILLQKPNVLLMDEPTNHLDIASCQAREGALAGYPGTILCVSHDRYFLDRTATSLLILEPPNLRQFEGTYTQWHAKVKREQAERNAKPAQNKKQPQRPSQPQRPQSKIENKKSKITRGPHARLTPEALEQQIAQSEAAILDLEMVLSDAATARDGEKSREARRSYEAVKKKLSELEAEYYSRE